MRHSNHFVHLRKYRLNKRLHPKLEVPGLTCRPAGKPTRSSTVGGEYSRKELFERLLIAIRNIYILYESATSGKCLRHGFPQCMCYMNIHEHTLSALRCRPNSTCKASAKYLPAAKTAALASPHIHCQTGQITSGSPQ